MELYAASQMHSANGLSDSSIGVQPQLRRDTFALSGHLVRPTTARVKDAFHAACPGRSPGSSLLRPQHEVHGGVALTGGLKVGIDPLLQLIIHTLTAPIRRRLKHAVTFEATLVESLSFSL